MTITNTISNPATPGTSVDAADVTTPDNELLALLNAFLNGTTSAEQVRMDLLGAVPATPAANKRKIYFKSGGMFFVDEAGAEHLLLDSTTSQTAESKQYLSGSPGTGRNIKVAATSTPGTTIHTADGSLMDTLWLYAINSDTSSRKLTIEFGGTSSPDDLIEITIPPESGPILIVPGIPITGSVVVRAFCATANVVTIMGQVFRGTMNVQPFSGSTSGRMIKVAATASAGTLIHTAATGSTKDEIWLYAVNSDTVPRKLTIEFGGTTAPDDIIEITIPAESGLSLVVPGIVLGGGLVVRAFCAAANVVNVAGYVVRTT